MVGRLYTWRTGACSEGVWRVVCRWYAPPGVKVVHNVLVEEVVPFRLEFLFRRRGEDGLPDYRPLPTIWHPTGKRIVRPWYPAPRRVDA